MEVVFRVPTFSCSYVQLYMLPRKVLHASMINDRMVTNKELIESIGILFEAFQRSKPIINCGWHFLLL